MPALAVRPLPRPPLPPGSPPPSPLRAGLPAALWALGAGLACAGLPALLVWAADSRSSSPATTALRGAAQVWLAAHGVPFALPAGRLSFVVLGLLLLPLVLLVRAGGLAARQVPVDTLREAGAVTAGVAGPYALVAALVAALARGDGVRPSVPGALLCASVLALVGAGTGVLRTSGLDAGLRARVPALARRLAPPAVAAVLVVLSAGALLAGLRLALALGEARALADRLVPGLVGGVALLLVCVVLVPTAVVWAATWWVGPGFGVGAGTAVGPFSTRVGPLPDLPLLAALPSGPLPVAVAVLGLLVPLAAGVLAGRMVVRSGTATPLREAALSGPVAGALLGVLALLCTGSVGGGRLRAVGPSAWQVALALALEVALPAVLTAWWATRSAARD